MKFLFPAVIVGVVVVATVFVHAVGFALLSRSFRKSEFAVPTRTWPVVALVVRVTLFLLLIHAIEITLWALGYVWAGCLPDLESALYFSGITYTTIGYGDLVLPDVWRLLGPIEGLIGIIMCGLSAGLFFSLASRIHQARREANRE